MPDGARPLVGCGAAVWNERSQVLLIKRLREPDAGCWGLPGGKVDWGEPVRATIAREVFEELGIEISDLRLACMTETIDGGDGKHWVAPVFETQTFTGVPRLMEPEKHEGFGWFGKADLPAPLTQPFRQYLQHLASLPNRN